MRSPVLLFAFALGISAAASSSSDYLSVKRKFDSIEANKVKPGGRVVFGARELNAYVQKELPDVAPAGVRDPHVDLLGDNIARGRAKINFLQLRSAQGKSSNWLLRKMLDGERDVAVTTRVESAGGVLKVFLQRVEISGVPLEGSALDFVIDNYLLPNYPNAKIGKPIPLKYRMDRLEVKPGEAHVVIKG